MNFLGKKYQLVSSENFDEFLEAFGIDQATRKVFTLMTPTVELTQDGESYTLLVSTKSMTYKCEFKLGEEVQEEVGGGIKTNSVYNLEGNILKQVQKCPDGLEVTYVREFGPKQMKAILTAKDVTCTRVYEIQ